MGLDNGIVLRANKFTRNAIDQIHEFSLQDFCSQDGEWDVCYWRKSYSLRDEIAQVIDFTNNGESPLTIDNLESICTILVRNLDKQYYDENYDGIWEYTNVVQSFTSALGRIKLLIHFLKTHPNEYECFFYDSY